MNTEEYKFLYDLEDKHWLYMGLRDLLMRQIREHFKIGAKVMILDAGCGTGYNLKCLESFGESVGLDINDNAIAYCRKRGINRLAQASILEMPFKDGSFDLVVSTDVLYHNSVENDLKALNEISRVLKKGGLLILNLPAHDYLKREHDENVHTRHRYERNEVLQKLKENNFNVIKASYRNAVSFPLLLLAGLINRIFRGELDTGLRAVPKPVNSAMYFLLKIENILLKAVDIPFGVSVFCLARK